MGRLSINIASRGRPDLLIETIRTTLSNIVLPDTTLMVSVDEDDWETQAALMREWSVYPDHLLVDVREREDSLGAKFNRVLTAAPAERCYLPMVDYRAYVTLGFDRLIIDAAGTLPKGIGVVYNKLANLSFPEIQALTVRFVELIGFVHPPYWPFWFADHFIDDVARMTGLIAVAHGVELDNRHDRRPGGATQSLRDIAFWAELYDRTYRARELSAVEIIKCLDIPIEYKKLLINQFPLIRQRSQMINDGAVAQVGAWYSEAENPRHARLREKAQALLAELGEPPIEPPGPAVPHPLGVIFATPSLSHTVASEYDISMQQTLVALSMHQIPMERMTADGDPFVDHVRNKLVTWFLERYPQAQNLFFLDDDIGWPAEKVIEFLRRPEDIVVGGYEKKQKDRDFPVSFEVKNGGLVWSEDGKLIKTTWAATGFMRIKRHVLEAMAAKYGTFREVNEEGEENRYFALFLHGIGPDEKWWGEDGAFVERAIGMGFTIWCDPDVSLSHRGTHVWHTRLRDHLDGFLRHLDEGDG